MDRKQQILQTRGTIDGWVQRGRSAEAPQPGSELETDDKIFPARRVSETARLALIAASEHLQLVCQIVDGRRAYATAAHTVLRSALLGATTAVWILGPSDSHERQQRALRLAREWYRRIALYTEVSRPHCPARDLPQLERQIKDASDQAAAVRRLWQATATLTAGQIAEDTKTVSWVANFLFASEPEKATTLRRNWAEHSGDAHALGWQLVGRRTAPLKREPGGFRLTAAEGDVAKLADPYLASYTVLKRGWSLFDQRCTGI